MDKIDWLKIIIPALAPFVAWIIYKLNSKQKIREKQYEAIADLIKVLNESEIEFFFMEATANGGGGGRVFTWTLVDIGKKTPQSIVSEFDDVPVYFQTNSNRLKGIEANIKNPYIPSKIKNILKNFSASPYDKIDKREIKDDTSFVTMNTQYYEEKPPFDLKANEKPGQLKLPDAIGYATWFSFKTTCSNLVIEINRQLEKINASDLKI